MGIGKLTVGEYVVFVVDDGKHLVVFILVGIGDMPIRQNDVFPVYQFTVGIVEDGILVVINGIAGLIGNLASVFVQ